MQVKSIVNNLICEIMFKALFLMKNAIQEKALLLHVMTNDQSLFPEQYDEKF